MPTYSKERIDLALFPSNGETLKGYQERLASAIEQHRYSYAPQHEKWFTHYSPSPCWICNVLDMLQHICDILGDIWKEDKKGQWKCVKPVGSPDKYSFSFKRYPK